MAVLSLLYDRWLQQFLEAEIPAESKADCSDCPMCSLNTERNRSDYIFSAQTKCCTYWPDLPNFLAGFILGDQTAEMAAGKRQFLHQFRETLILTPLGAHPPAQYWEQYSNGLTLFGQNRQLRCPYYIEDGGRCGIWRYRSSRCATWFCRFVRGSTGVIFWKYMDQFLQTLERTILRWCILQLHPGDEAMTYIFPPPPTERSEEDVPKMWGRWKGKEMEFYCECALLVEDLPFSQILLLGGVELATAGELLQQAFRNLTASSLPDSLKSGTWKKVRRLTSGNQRIWSYNPYDPVDISPAQFEALHEFDSGPLPETLERLRREKGVEFSKEQLRQLIDTGILVPAEQAQQITDSNDKTNGSRR